MGAPDGRIGRDLELAFLDMSGTVFHDNGVMERAFGATLAGLGVEPGTDRFRRLVDELRDTPGRSRTAVLENHFAAEPDRARQAVRDFERQLDVLLADEGVVPVEGAEEAVAELRRAGLQVCLATGYTRHNLNTILERLGWMGLADLSLCPSDAGRARPWPDMVLTAVLALDVGDVRRVLVVGDTVADVQAGLRAGSTAVVGVRTGAHDAAALRTAGVHAVVDSVREVPALVRASSLRPARTG